MCLLCSQAVNDLTRYTLPETNSSPLKIDPGKGDSYWRPPFSGAMLVSGRVVWACVMKENPDYLH